MSGEASSAPPEREEEGALREVARLARDLYEVSPEEALRRLDRLTEEQRARVDLALQSLLKPGVG